MQRKKLISVKTCDNILAHEASIASALQDASDRFRAINKRLNQHSKSRKQSKRSARKVEWMRIRRETDREEDKLTKQIEDIVRRIEARDERDRSLSVDLNSARIDFYEQRAKFQNDVASLIRKRKHVSSSSLQVKCIRQQLTIIGEDLKEEYVSVGEELKILEDMIKRNRSRNMRMSNSVLPQKVVDMINYLRNEFHFVLSEQYAEGMGPKLEEDIQLLKTSLLSNFSHLMEENRVEIAAAKSVGKVMDESNWDERKELILHSAFRQWSKTRKPHEKKQFLQKVAQETGFDLIICKEKWKFHETSNISQVRDSIVRSQHKKDHKELVNLAVEDIENMRQSIICHLACGVCKSLNEEISLENEHRLGLLKSLRLQMEERQQEEELRLKMITEEESRVLASKKHAERLETQRKLRLHLDCKEEEIRQVRANDLKRQNDEEEARLQRLAKNGERVRFRQRQLQKKAKIRSEELEKSYNIEVERQRRLNALAASVPYYAAVNSIIPNIHKATISRTNDVFVPASEDFLSDFQQGLKKMTGFTDDKVFSDPKFRLAHQLHESGVASSAYSCAVVKALIPREPERTTGIQPY